MPYLLVCCSKGFYSYAEFVRYFGLSISSVTVSCKLRGVQYRRKKPPKHVKAWSPWKVVKTYCKVELIPDPAVRRLVMDRLYRLPVPPSFRSRVDYLVEDDD